MENVAILPPQPPLKFNATPASLLAAAAERKQAALKAMERIVADVRPEDATFENTILPLIENQNQEIYNDPPITLYSRLSTSEELREASRDAERLLSDTRLDLPAHEEIYHLVTAVLSRYFGTLDEESKIYLTRKRHMLLESGFGIPKGPERERYREIRKRTQHLKIEIQKNQSSNKEGIWLPCEDLEGVPEDALKTFPQGEGENANKLWVELKPSQALLINRRARRSATRRLVWVKNSYKCPENTEMLREVFILRDEGARLLNYPSYAAFQLQVNLLTSPDMVSAFLNNFRSQIAPKITALLEEIMEVKKRFLEVHPQQSWDDPERLFLWDFDFYRRLYQEGKYGDDEREVREYFPLETTFLGLLELLESLFQIRFESIETDQQKQALASPDTPESLTWHEGVKMFCVWDAEERGGSFLGYLYYDFYAREGKTRNPITHSVQKGFLEQDRRRRYPTSVVMTSFDKPTKDKPCLLETLDIITILHETGHGLHNLLSRTQYGLLHGTGVSRDFVEIPSTVMEKFITRPGVLRHVSCHYTYLSPEYADTWRKEHGHDGTSMLSLPLPEKHISEERIISSLEKSKDGKCFWHNSNISLSLFDMAVHHPASHLAIKEMNIAETYNRIRRDVRMLHGLESLGEELDWGYSFGQFTHLSGPSAAQYYSYVTCRTYAFAIFETMNDKDEEKYREQCRRFRDIILKPGGSRHGLELLDEFFGEKYSLEAIIQKFGAVNI